MKRPSKLTWQSMDWTRPFEFDTVCNFTTQLNGFSRRQPFIWEIRLTKEKVSHLLGADLLDMRYLSEMITSHNPVRFEKTKRSKVTSAYDITLSKSHYALKTKEAEIMIRSFLSQTGTLKRFEEIVLQLVVGKSSSPKPILKDLGNPDATFWQKVTGNIPPLSSDSKALIREKLHHSQFQVSLRLGIRADNKAREIQILKSVLASLRILERAGARFSAKPISVEKLNHGHLPWHFQTILSSIELASLFCLPAGDAQYAGVSSLSPKTILPPIGFSQNTKRLFGYSLEKSPRFVGIPAREALSHTWLLGGTGSGKSTTMLNLFVADARENRSAVVIDPKATLVSDILERLPKERDKDVVILDPSQSGQNISINPFDLVNFGVPAELVADMLLGVFQEIFEDSWGIYTQDILSHSFHTLAKVGNSTLLDLPKLLTNKTFRHEILKSVSDPFLLDFWQGFDTLSDSARQTMISPVLNKFRSVLLRPALRAIFGKSSGNFSLKDIFDKPRLLLVPLNKGLIGAENAKFIGAILLGCLYQLTLLRAKETIRKPVFIYIDEVADYLKLPVPLDDALSMSRSLGVGYILANQFSKQLPKQFRESIYANCYTQIIFGLSMNEARELASLVPELSAEDFYKLPPFQGYTRVPIVKNTFKWISAKTLPASPAFRKKDEIYGESFKRYGSAFPEEQSSQPASKPIYGIGRKKKEVSDETN
ncbi:TPA: type IV secretion system DNA-binding domain-containing protein [Streptococcus equi subsp. zooepidemicus]|uniref:type IV secretory system conjugative DNA transfer family protein n=1 Tax=Streptococcus equi TaxID=1336 RepID=UPI0005B8ECDA|nr:type IV secretion system DNA-binding domain-containing protein [Streptococcus equi]HEL0726943.1 type IV secretion system DNA-binding domain-containing protein [Streptococcus equi subsp. zooepidemicus]KIS11567.1 Type IV secretory pathway, VirD4 component [Streptococcus equi subsp. zooepidemicus Sz57]HEL1077934.1 type IV secretion system DNA-binding domain-containing protein [Streptococcus equi subsp. zooepidemicus]HEL1208969.1 type IV secretion system DNA-binding domain-containing protein [St